MAVIRNLGVWAAVVLLPVGVIVAAVPAASAAALDVTNLDVQDVKLFNPTDPGTASGYLQAAIDVQYSCSQGTSGQIQGEYGSLDENDPYPLTCVGQAISQRLYARLPLTDTLAPEQPNVVDNVGVSYSLDGGGGGALGDMVTSTVATTQPNDNLTDLFPPYQPSFASRVGHPSQQFAIFEPPLTTGGHTIDHYRVNYRLDGGKTKHVTLKDDDLVHGLKTHKHYRMSITVVATDGSETTTKVHDVTTPKRLDQKVGLNADDNKVKPHHAVTLSGHVHPAHGGHVVLQKRTDGSWQKVTRLHLGDSGGFSHKVHPGLGATDYRVKAPTSADYHSDTSPTVTVHVHS